LEQIQIEFLYNKDADLVGYYNDRFLLSGYIKFIVYDRFLKYCILSWFHSFIYKFIVTGIGIIRDLSEIEIGKFQNISKYATEIDCTRYTNST